MAFENNGGLTSPTRLPDILMEEQAMQILNHALISGPATFEQLAAPKVLNGLNTFDEHLWTCASLNGRRNCRTSLGGAASSSRAFDRHSTTCSGAQGVQTFEHLVEHLARLSILRRFQKLSRDEKFRFSTTSTTGEEKCRGVEFEILSTLAPFRGLLTEFFAATLARLRLSPRSKVGRKLSAFSDQREGGRRAEEAVGFSDDKSSAGESVALALQT